MLYARMYPVAWAGNWGVPEAAETRSPLQRPPVDREYLAGRFKGRRDDGPLPGMAAGVLEGMRVRLRKTHYSYRTEQTYFGLGAASFYFRGVGSQDELSFEDLKSYLEFLAVERRVAAATQPSGAR